MLKANLKENWGMYCDTDKLVDDVMTLLTKYHHKCTEEGVCAMLHTYFTNKKSLIDMFMTSDSYIGNMRICIDVELERTGNQREIQRFCETFSDRIKAHEVFLKYVDENGKTLKDYTRVGTRRFKARNLCYGNMQNMLVENSENRKKFNTDGSTKESWQEYARFKDVIYSFRHSSTVLVQDTVHVLTHYKINGKFVARMKTSRAFNRVCSIYGVDKLPEYNKIFAEYADMVSGLTRKMKFYISLNPLDYLTMSFGKSWASCHTIDKKNERGMQNSYSGMYCGGTLSYMLDETSFITYVHTHATEDHEEGKIYRNMFHFNNGTLVQGRIYPQGNDGATDLYKTFRRFVQIELTQLLGLNADDWLRRSASCGDNTSTHGVHYADYLNFSGCNVSYPREMPDAAYNTVRIGHERICPNCGEVVDNEEDTGYLCHSNCQNEW